MKRQIPTALLVAVACWALVVPALAGAQDIATQSRSSAAPAPVQSDPGPSGPYLSKVDHLRIAAEQLAAAGLKDDADRLWQLAAKEESRGPAAFIQVNLCMLEMPMSKLTEMSSQRYKGSKGASALASLLLNGNATSGGALMRSSFNELVAVIEALRRDGFAEVLAQPSLMVSADTPATVNTGEFLGGAETGFGTRADVLAFLAANDKIHLDFHLRVCRPDTSRPVAGIPPVISREVETGFELSSGQTIVVRTGGERNPNNGETMLMFTLVRAEFVKKVAAANAKTEK